VAEEWLSFVLAFEDCRQPHLVIVVGIPIFAKVAATARALLSRALRNALAPIKEDTMSSTQSLHRATRYLSRFRYVDFIIKSTPLICMAFVLYLILHGTFG